MISCKEREELSHSDKLRRSYYELLRDDLDQFLLEYSLIDSYKNFKINKIPYPFVEKRELKPRARIPDIEYQNHNTFLIIFIEDIIPESDENKIVLSYADNPSKINFFRSKAPQLSCKFDRSQKCLESVRLFNFLKILLPDSNPILIQRDGNSIAKDEYSLSHYNIKIDWSVENAAEDLARSLRYISKDLHEKGDKYAEDIQKKLFEFYGISPAAGIRRTTAIKAAQYLKKLACLNTIYVGSSKNRALIRFSENIIFKIVLMKFSDKEISQIAASNNMVKRTFKTKYVIAGEGKEDICIFRATYIQTHYAKPPEDGKLREIKSDMNWLAVGGQHILPKPEVINYPPLPLNIIYS